MVVAASPVERRRKVTVRRGWGAEGGKLDSS